MCMRIIYFFCQMLLTTWVMTVLGDLLRWGQGSKGRGLDFLHANFMRRFFCASYTITVESYAVTGMFFLLLND